MNPWNAKPTWLSEALAVINQSVGIHFRGQAADAEDLIQNLTMELLTKKSPDDFPELSNLHAYIHATIKFRVISHFRKLAKAARSLHCQEQGEIEVLQQNTDSVEDAFDKREDLARLRLLLAELSQADRSQLAHTFFNDLDDRELAKLCYPTLPQDAARQRIGRRRRMVLRELAKKMDAAA